MSEQPPVADAAPDTPSYQVPVRIIAFIVGLAACWLARDLLIPIKAGVITRRHVRAELAELVAGTRRGRTSPQEITLFKSVGFAPEDAVTARLAYDRAVAAGLGTEVSL